MSDVSFRQYFFYPPASPPACATLIRANRKGDVVKKNGICVICQKLVEHPSSNERYSTILAQPFVQRERNNGIST